MADGGLSAAQLIAAAADALKERKEEVNKLNVFPVPDGDTGTNMSLTMDAVLADLGELAKGASPAQVCHAVAHGSLMGARGNSGVILSQILRGLCEVVGEAGTIDGPLVAAALDRAVTVAFQAVRKPVEGTMLTVLRDAAHAAEEAAAAGLELVPTLESVVQAAYVSVRRTPDLLPVLKEAGVVDAGGYGLAILAEGFTTALAGHAVHVIDLDTGSTDITVVPENDWDDDEYLYCTEFLLLGTDADKHVLEEFVAGVGGSELVVGDRETYKIHVHTDDPARVMAWATSLGQVAEVHINNMREQTMARTRQLQTEDVAPAKPIGFVAVATGSGMADILKSLGVDVVVNGGQTMNPSTKELLEACESVNAEACIILPNNKNIIMAAQQVTDVSSRPVAVVPTTSVPAAFAALLGFEPSMDLQTATDAMTEASETVRAGEVTTAVKDSTSKLGPITAGQIIGISDHEIVAVGTDVLDVTMGLIATIADGGETLTLLAGQDLADEDLARLVERIESDYPSIEVDAHRGDQPLYPVVLSIE